MNISIILASGNGTRVQSQLIPKQFIKVNNKPIFIHTIEKFLTNGKIDLIVLTCNQDWIELVQQDLQKYFKQESKKIHVVSGGNSRSHSLLNAVNYLNKNIKPKDDDVILTHDSVRMFVSNEIINTNIVEAKKHDVIIDTCVKAIDTIVYSEDKTTIKEIPNRDQYYYGQTPQSGKYHLIKKIFAQTYDTNIFANCDLCKLAHLCNISIKMVDGDYFNFKITTDFDLLLIKKILNSNE